MAYPSVRSSRAAEITPSNTSHTIQLPATVSAGDYLFVVFTCDDNTSSPFTTVTWDNSSAGTWTQLYSAVVTVTTTNAGASVQEVWYKVADGTEDSVNLTITTSITQPSTYYTASIQDCSGIAAGTPTTNSNTSTLTPDPPSLTTGWGSVETLWFVILGVDNGTATTVTAYPTNYSDNQGINGSGTGTARTARASRNLTAASDDPGTFTLDNSRPTIVNTIAFKPLSTGLSITSITPTDVYSQQVDVVVAGTKLSNSATVTFAGAACTGLSASSSTSLKITMPNFYTNNIKVGTVKELKIIG